MITSFTVTPASAPAGTDVTVSVTVENFELREPTIEEGLALRAAHDVGPGEEGAYPEGGHFHVYLDSTETNPMFIDCPDYCEHGASKSPARARIPEDEMPGEHTVIVRLNNDVHEFLRPEIEATASLTVTME